MGRIIFTWELGANSGHWAHMRPIAERLAEHGHDVYAALRKVDAVSGHWDDRYPLTLLQAPYLSTPQSRIIRDVRSYVHVLNNVGYYDPAVLRTGIDAWRNLYRLTCPDVIVFEHSPTAMIAARGVECKQVVIGDGFCIPPSEFPLPDLLPWLPPANARLARDERQVVETINQALNEVRVKSVVQLADLFAQVDQQFLLTYTELDHYGASADRRYLGSWGSTGTARCQWRMKDKKFKLFAYLRMFPGIRTILQQLLQFDCEVIAYLPDCEPELAHSLRNGNVHIVTQPVYLPGILDRCDLSILNANVSTVSSFLRAGVPSLNFPLYLEQVLASYRIAQGQLGTTYPANQVANCGGILEQVLADDIVKQNAVQFAQKYRGLDASSLEFVVRGIEELVSFTGK